MIIGRGKSEQIAAEPLLAGYLSLFERVLSSGRKRLLVCVLWISRRTHAMKLSLPRSGKKEVELFVLSSAILKLVSRFSRIRCLVVPQSGPQFAIFLVRSRAFSLRPAKPIRRHGTTCAQATSHRRIPNNESLS